MLKLHHFYLSNCITLSAACQKNDWFGERYPFLYKALFKIISERTESKITICLNVGKLRSYFDDLN